MPGAQQTPGIVNFGAPNPPPSTRPAPKKNATRRHGGAEGAAQSNSQKSRNTIFSWVRTITTRRVTCSVTAVADDWENATGRREGGKGAAHSNSQRVAIRFSWVSHSPTLSTVAQSYRPQTIGKVRDDPIVIRHEATRATCRYVPPVSPPKKSPCFPAFL